MIRRLVVVGASLAGLWAAQAARAAPVLADEPSALGAPAGASL